MTNQNSTNCFPTDDFLSENEMCISFSVTNSEGKRFSFHHDYKFGTRWIEILTDMAGVLDSAGYVGAKDRLERLDDQMFAEMDSKIATPRNP